MKSNYLFVFFIFISANLFSQRYYPRLNSILSKDIDRKIPDELNDFYNWFHKSTENVYYQDLQTSSSSNSTFFYNLKLMFLKEKVFSLGNSMIKFNVLENSIDKPLNINLYEKVSLLNYVYFDPAKYSSKDLKKKFFYYKAVTNLTEEQFLAAVINYLDEIEGFSINRISSLDLFYKKFNKRSDFKLKKEQESTLHSINKEIQEKSKMLTSEYLYKLFFYDKDPKEELIKVSTLYKSQLREHYSKKTDELAGLNAELVLNSSSFEIDFPTNIIENIENPKENFKLQPKNIKIIVNHFENDEPSVDLEFTNFTKNNNKLKIRIVQEEKINKAIFSAKGENIALPIVESDSIDKIIFKIFKNKLIIVLEYKDDYKFKIYEDDKFLL